MSNREPPRPTDGTPLGEYPYVIVRARCHVCQRRRDARTAVLAWHFGHWTPVGTLLRIFMSRCPWDPHSLVRKPQKYSHRCGAYLPDITSGRPPDLPPALAGLSLIEGGRDDMLPAEPVAPERRRRVGGAE